jgi:hypothetical protein
MMGCDGDNPSFAQEVNRNKTLGHLAAMLLKT